MINNEDYKKILEKIIKDIPISNEGGLYMG